MKSLEYNGPYGGRYTCRDCTHCPVGGDYQPCDLLNIDVLTSNNVCRSFDSSIKNPSAPDFNFDDYLEYLGSDFYRPWNVDTEIIVGSAKLGEAILDGGRLAELLPKTYSPWYKSYDKPYCRTNFPRCHVRVTKDGVNHKFEIDYRLYREQSFLKDGEIQFVIHLWKDKPTQRKYHKKINGRWSLNGKSRS